MRLSSSVGAYLGSTIAASARTASLRPLTQRTSQSTGQLRSGRSAASLSLPASTLRALIWNPLLFNAPLTLSAMPLSASYRAP